MSLFSRLLQPTSERRGKGGRRKGAKALHVTRPHVKKPSVKSHGLAVYGAKHKVVTNLIRSLIAEEERIHTYLQLANGKMAGSSGGGGKDFTPALAHAKSGAYGKGTAGAAKAEHPGTQALRDHIQQMVSSTRASHSEALASNPAMAQALMNLSKAASSPSKTGTVIPPSLTPIWNPKSYDPYMPAVATFHSQYGTAQLHQALTAQSKEELVSMAKGEHLATTGTHAQLVDRLANYQIAKDGIITAPGVAATKAEQALYQKALAAQSKSAGGAKANPVGNLPQPIAQLTWDYAPDPSAPPNTAYLSQGFGWNAIPALLSNINRDRLLQSVEMVESRHGVTMPGKASATRASLINWLTDQARQGHTNDANGNGIIPPTNPKYPVPAPLSVSATKAAKPVPTVQSIADLTPVAPIDNYVVNSFAPLNDRLILQRYGPEQFPTALGGFSRDMLKSVADAIQKEYPGTKPTSRTSKSALIQYIVDMRINPASATATYATKSKRMQAPLDYWLASL